MKKNRKKAASTAPTSRGSTGAMRVIKRARGPGCAELVVVFIAAEYTRARDGWNRVRRHRTSTASRYFSSAGATLLEATPLGEANHGLQIVVVTRGACRRPRRLRQ